MENPTHPSSSQFFKSVFTAILRAVFIATLCIFTSFSQHILDFSLHLVYFGHTRIKARSFSCYEFHPPVTSFFWKAMYMYIYIYSQTSS